MAIENTLIQVNPQPGLKCLIEFPLTVFYTKQNKITAYWKEVLFKGDKCKELYPVWNEEKVSQTLLG